MTRILSWTLAFLMLVLSPTAWAAAEQRIALVIGNGAYREAPLRNPVNDARGITTMLRDLNFDVRVLENADRQAMQRAILEFGRKLNEGVVGLFYFAGHGVQVKGVNYLIPINAVINGEDEVEVEGVDVNYVLSRMATAKNKFNIVVLDACRNNPFERGFRSGGQGLAAINAPTGTLIAYATAPGALAADGETGNGLYTGELINALRLPNLTLEETFKRTRSQVVSRSGGRQTPWESSSVIGNFVFRPTGQPTSSPSDGAAEDVALWNAVKDSRDPSDYATYLEKNPTGLFASLARYRMLELTNELETRLRAEREARTQQETDRKAPLQSGERRPPSGSVTASAAPPPAPPKPAPPKTASLTTSDQDRPLSATDQRAALDQIKENWPAIQKTIQKHFYDNVGVFTFNINGARDLGWTTLAKSSVFDVMDYSDTGIVVKVLITGRVAHPQFPGFNAPSNYSSFVKYEIAREKGQFVIRSYEYLGRS